MAGRLYGWKKAHLVTGREVLIRLAVPAWNRVRYVSKDDPQGAIRLAGEVPRSARGKMRAERVLVHHIEDARTGERLKDVVALSPWDGRFAYSTGRHAPISYAPFDPFDEDPKAWCAAGIHFFRTRKEALAW